MQELWDDRFQPADAEIVKQKARQLIGRRRLREHEFEDIEQEMALRVIEQSHLHDPQRGSREGFVGTTAANAYWNLHEKRTAKKRDDRRNISIDVGPSGALHDGRLTQEQIDLALDLKQAVDRMPPDLRQVYDLRLAGHSETELQGLLNLSRGQVRTLTARLKTYLEPYIKSPDSDDLTAKASVKSVHKK
jgi:DNA-directed RNA polymerase specialized sigma24 family protein